MVANVHDWLPPWVETNPHHGYSTPARTDTVVITVAARAAAATMNEEAKVVMMMVLPC
jgi:hypothetical protein